MISLNRVGAVMLRQFYLMRGSISRVVPLFSWVAVDIILWGFMTTYMNTLTLGEHNFVPSLLGAVLLWDFFIRVMQGVTTTFFEDVWSRNFLNYFATPLTISEYILGLIGSSVVSSAVGLVAMVALASAAFGLSFLPYGLLMIPFLLNLFVFGIALGIFATAIVLRLGPASEWFIWPIPAPLSPFVGVFYPLSVLPEWMQIIGRLLPPSYIFQGMRSIIAGYHAHASQLWMAVGLDLIYLLLAYATFVRTYKYAVRTGLIARYSAESVA